MDTKGKCLWKKWYHKRNVHWLKQIKKKNKVSNPPKNPTVLPRHCLITFMLVKGWNTNLGKRTLCRQRNALGITEFSTQIIKFASCKHFSIWEAILILFEEYIDEILYWWDSETIISCADLKDSDSGKASCTVLLNPQGWGREVGKQSFKTGKFAFILLPTTNWQLPRAFARLPRWC